MTRVAKAEALIGYNALGSYAHIESKRDPSVGYVYPRDYTLVVTRVMLIGKKTVNPNAAKLWIDYLLPRRGQTVLASCQPVFAAHGRSGRQLGRRAGEEALAKRQTDSAGTGPVGLVFRPVKATGVPQAMAASHRYGAIEPEQCRKVDPARGFSLFSTGAESINAP